MRIVWRRNWKGIPALDSTMICGVNVKSMYRIITFIQNLTHHYFRISEYQNWRLMCIIFYHQSHSEIPHFSFISVHLWCRKHICRCRNTFYLCKFALKLWHLYWHVFATPNYFSQVYMYIIVSTSRCGTWIIGTCILNKIVHLSLDLSSVKINWNTCHHILITAQHTLFFLLSKVVCERISATILYYAIPHPNSFFSLNYFSGRGREWFYPIFWSLRQRLICLYADFGNSSMMNLSSIEFYAFGTEITLWKA